MIYRRRSFVLRLLISAVLLWLSFVLFIGNGGIPSKNRDDDHAQSHRTNWKYDLGLGGVDVRRPDHPDRLRFEAAVTRGAEEEKEREKLEDKLALENGRAERIHNRGVRPLIAEMQIEDPAVGSGPTHPPVVDGVDLSAVDNITRRLIEKGLVVPKWNLEREIPGTPNGTGEFGVGVKIVNESLSAAERQAFDVGWERNAFNQYLSDRISLHRALPDVRHAECKTRKYREKLPSASAIIIFHNEAWTAVFRTVHSVLDRSPPHLIKEIILVDDFSDLDHLKMPLEDYVAKLEKVRLVRTNKREGLIRARLLGASVATAEVLIFLDAHCECTKGWLEPLLDRIAENRTNVVEPLIDDIDDDTFEYRPLTAKSLSIGGFDWTLSYSRFKVPDREKKRRKSEIDPIRTPTIVGCLFGISREFFEYLGAYDPGMGFWGGENLEISFKIWMCGGILEQVICSHVGHLYRHRNPHYRPSDGLVVKRNSVRLAEVWLDEYKEYYYERINFDLGDYGDITSRKELRKKLQCKSFDWYLKNVCPEIFVPSEALASGEIRNKMPGSFDGIQRPVCLDAVFNVLVQKQVKLWPCHSQGGNQIWQLSKDGEIRRDNGCVDFNGEFVRMYPCHGMKGNQDWIFGLDNSIRHRSTYLCLQSSDDGTKLEIQPCTGIDRQIWYWRRRNTTASVRQEFTSSIPAAK